MAPYLAVSHHKGWLSWLHTLDEGATAIMAGSDQSSSCSLPLLSTIQAFTCHISGTRGSNDQLATVWCRLLAVLMRDEMTLVDPFRCWTCS